MQHSKEEVLGIIITQPNGNIEEKCFKKKFPEIYQEVLNCNLPSDFKWTQKLFHYFYNDFELKLGLCPVCGKRCNFETFSHGYKKHCSYKCAQQNEDTQNKIMSTNLKRYGVKRAAQSDICKNKSMKTNLEKYGVEHHTQSSIVKEKIKQTCLDRYGVENPTKTIGVQEKMKQTCLDRYGVENFSQCDEFKQKYKNTMIQTYGVEHYSKTKDYVSKCQSTNLKRYGVISYAQSNEFIKYHKKRIEYDNLTFDSSWEVEVYKFCQEHNIPCEYQPNIQFEYEYDGKKHIYQPDFLINGKIYEVKGDQFFDGDKMICPYDRNDYNDAIAESKHQCMKNNGVIILRKREIKNLKNILF